MNYTGPTARQLIDEAVDLEAEDLAAEFIETELGRFYFDTSWKTKRESYDLKLRQWLEANGQRQKYDEVAALIDQWSEQGHSWNDRWETDYSGGEKPKSVKHKPKKKRSPVDGNTVQSRRQSAA